MRIIESKIIHREDGDLFCFLGEQGENYIIIQDMADFFGCDNGSFACFAQRQYTYSNDDVAELRGVVASLRSNGNVSYKGNRYAVERSTMLYVIWSDWRGEDCIGFTPKDIENKRHLELADFLEAYVKDIL